MKKLRLGDLDPPAPITNRAGAAELGRRRKAVHDNWVRAHPIVSNQAAA